jgi:hypothetical protein
MIGKKFTSLMDGRIVEVKDAFEDIVILQDNSKIKASRLLDKSYYDEYIDPSNFFQNQSLLNTFAQKIKQIPDEILSKMSDEAPDNINESIYSKTNSGDNTFRPRFDEPAVLQADPELERMELMRKYGIKENTTQVSPVVESQKQLERFKHLIDELQNEEEQEIQRVVVEREEVEQSVPLVQNVEQGRIVHRQVQEDPIITMFKNVKRVKDFKITVDIENKIPRPDFIEMMEDSYNISLIDFLADEFTNEILQNPDSIKEKIKSEINRLVYGEKVTKNTKTDPVTKKTRTTRNKKISLTND